MIGTLLLDLLWGAGCDPGSTLGSEFIQMSSTVLRRTQAIDLATGHRLGVRDSRIPLRRLLQGLGEDVLKFIPGDLVNDGERRHR